MKQVDLRILSIAALLLLPLLPSCDSDSGFSGSGFQNQFNPNPGATPPPPNPQTSCQMTYALDATLDATFSKGPNQNEVDHTFYFVSTSQSLTLLNNTCPFAVENFFGQFEFAVGRYIGPPLPQPASPLQALTATASGALGDVDLFGIFVNTALIQGVATTIDSTHLSFTLLYPETPYWSLPNCLLSSSVTDGNLEIASVSATDMFASTPTQYHLSATVPIVVKHASNIASCIGVFPDLTP